METKDQPQESFWASFRNVQLKILSVPGTAMTVNIDLGEWNDIHPQNKEDVAKRMVMAARRLAYGEKRVVASGPIYQSMRVKGNSIVLTFTSCGSGLKAKDGKALRQFAVAGADKKYIWANAKIEGNKVIVWNEKIPSPVAVRYAWADNPEGANLYNAEGLPASPFGTNELF
jgi:sialate O-acetylesterase